MSASRIFKSDEAFADLQLLKDRELISHDFLRRSQKAIEAIKTDLNNIFALNTVSLFKHDEIIRSLKRLDKLMEKAEDDKIQEKPGLEETEKSTKQKIESDLGSLYKELQLRVQRLEKARQNEKAIFTSNYAYPKSYNSLVQNKSTAIEKAISIFDDYHKWIKLRFHHKRSHCHSARYLVSILNDINGERISPSEKEKKARDCIRFVKNNLIAQDKLQVDSKQLSSFLKRIHFVIDKLIPRPKPIHQQLFTTKSGYSSSLHALEYDAKLGLKALTAALDGKTDNAGPRKTRS